MNTTRKQKHVSKKTGRDHVKSNDPFDKKYCLIEMSNNNAIKYKKIADHYGVKITDVLATVLNQDVDGMMKYMFGERMYEEHFYPILHRR